MNNIFDILATDDYNHIIGNIFMGGDPSPSPDTMFDYIMNLYVWGDYKTRRGVEVYKYEMYDSSQMADTKDIHALADWVNEKASIGPVLVHCQAGLNRSGLVTALALIKQGMKPADAISLIRKKRSPMALCNPVFTKWLMSLDGTSGSQDHGTIASMV